MSDPSKDWDRHYDLFHQAPVIPVPQDILDQVEANADDHWLYGAEAAIWLCLTTIGEFTTATILQLLDEWGLKTHENRALGPVIQRFSRRKIIEKTGAYEETGSHGRPQPVWRKAKT